MALQEFSALILKRRKALGLTQEAVAARVGVHANYIGYLERGLRRPGDGTLVALADALDIDQATLFATLYPLFADIVQLPEDGRPPEPVPPALQRLVDDPALLARTGLDREAALRLSALSVFGEIRRPEDYVRIAALLREIAH